MKKFEIEVGGELAELIESSAKQRQMTAKAFIEEILSRFVISPHILDNEDVKRGYEESGLLNVEWANL